MGAAKRLKWKTTMKTHIINSFLCSKGLKWALAEMIHLDQGRISRVHICILMVHFKYTARSKLHGGQYCTYLEELNPKSMSNYDSVTRYRHRFSYGGSQTTIIGVLLLANLFKALQQYFVKSFFCAKQHTKQK